MKESTIDFNTKQYIPWLVKFFDRLGDRTNLFENDIVSTVNVNGALYQNMKKHLYGINCKTRGFKKIAQHRIYQTK